jgi:hypothetical protein
MDQPQPSTSFAAVVLLRELGEKAFASAFVEELNRGQDGDCSLIDELVGSAIEALGSPTCAAQLGN